MYLKRAGRRRAPHHREQPATAQHSRRAHAHLPKPAGACAAALGCHAAARECEGAALPRRRRRRRACCLPPKVCKCTAQLTCHSLRKDQLLPLQVQPAGAAPAQSSLGLAQPSVRCWAQPLSGSTPQDAWVLGLRPEELDAQLQLEVAGFANTTLRLAPADLPGQPAVGSPCPQRALHSCSGTQLCCIRRLTMAWRAPACAIAGSYMGTMPLCCCRPRRSCGSLPRPHRLRRHPAPPLSQVRAAIAALAACCCLLALEALGAAAGAGGVLTATLHAADIRLPGALAALGISPPAAARPALPGEQLPSKSKWGAGSPTIWLLLSQPLHGAACHVRAAAR